VGRYMRALWSTHSHHLSIYLSIYLSSYLPTHRHELLEEEVQLDSEAAPEDEDRQDDCGSKCTC
jgi:hypothetical protein